MVEKSRTVVRDRLSMEGPLSWPVFDVNAECAAWGVQRSKPGLSVYPSKRLLRSAHLGTCLWNLFA